MASTYTSNGIELIGDGEQSNTWGDTTNTNWELMEEMAAGGVSIALTGTTYTLTTTDGASSNGRHAVVTFLGSPGGTCTVTVTPNTVQKTYIIKNDSDETVTMSQGSGSTVNIAAGKSKIVFCDGAGAGAAVTNLSDGFDSTTLAELGITATAAELNIMDGVTATTAEINVLDGFTGSTADLNEIAGAATAGGVGKILQVVHAVKASDTTTSSTTAIDLSLSASITPSSASNTILVLVNVDVFSNNIGAGDDTGGGIQLLEDSSVVIQRQSSIHSSNLSNPWSNMSIDGIYLSSPATTSAVTFEVYGYNNNASGAGSVEFQASSTITVMEIAA